MITRNNVSVPRLLAEIVGNCSKFGKSMHTCVCLIRNHFISNLVLDSLKFKKLSELHGKS